MKAHKTYHWLWKSKANAKLKVFGWLMLSDRLNTRNMLKRRHFNIGTNLNCLLCGQKEEDIDHMILTCPFSRNCWATFGLDPGDQATRLSWLEQAKINWGRPLFHGGHPSSILEHLEREEQQTFQRYKPRLPLLAGQIQGGF